MTRTAAHTQKLIALHEAGLHSRDPVGWHYLQTLSRRAAALSGAAQGLLEQKLSQAIDAFEADVQNSPPASRPEAPPTSPLTQLLQELQAQRTRPAAATLSAGSASAAMDARLPPENPRVRQFRRQLHSIGVQKQVRQAIAQGPQNAGPINSHMLTLRALVLLRDISPRYLERFMTQVDTLLRLEDAQKQIQTVRRRSSAKKSG